MTIGGGDDWGFGYGQDDDGFGAAFGRMRAPDPHGDGTRSGADPTVRWGDEKTLAFDALATFQTSELLRVEIPRPALCRVQFHAEVIELVAPAGLVASTALELHIGNGSMVSRVRRRYLGLPQVAVGGLFLSPGIPLDVEWYVPLAHIYGRLACTAQNVKVRYSLWLTPVTPQTEAQK